jgi:hypothetical protein
MISPPCSRMKLLLDRVQQDEGQRGILNFLSSVEDLDGAVRGLCGLPLGSRVAILTGFPCNMDFDPPTETDGPPGALAVARCLIGLGLEVVLMTDDCNAEAIRSAAGSLVEVYSFPPSLGEQEARRLEELWQDVVAAIAIERPGPSAEGYYLTMRGLSMGKYVAPLDRQLSLAGRTFFTVGIGDGGNEVGMGKVHSRIVASGNEGLAASACMLSTDFLIVCSVSNWGAYCLIAAICLVSSRPELMPSPPREEEVLRALVFNGGARDGITGKKELTVDGMPFSCTAEVLEDLRAIVIQ